MTRGVCFRRNNHRGAQRQVLLDAPVQLSQISADNGKTCVFHVESQLKDTSLTCLLSSVTAAKDVQGIWMMKRPQNTVSSSSAESVSHQEVVLF